MKILFFGDIYSKSGRDVVKKYLPLLKNEYDIDLVIADRFYPSSKLCYHCGSIKKDLKLKDRIYKCNCGYIEDRDYNASLNLRDCLTYKIA